MGTERSDAWLDKVYGAADRARQQANYDAWAETYDEDIVRVGYLTPTIVAGLIARHVPPDAGPVLDAGCGTGLVGEILSYLGYPTLLGLDLSPGMLARAARRGVYAELRQGVLGEQLAFPDDSFAACYAAGVFTAGHAPARALDELVRIVRPGGCIAFNVGEQSWEADGFAAKLAELSAAARWRRLEQTRPYPPLPLSVAEGRLTAQGFAFQVL